MKFSEGKVSQVKDRISDKGKKERPDQHPGMQVLVRNAKGKCSSELEMAFVKL